MQPLAEGRGPKKKTLPLRVSGEQSVGMAIKAATQFELHKAPGCLIRRLDSRSASLYENFTGQADLTHRQFGVLLLLFQSGPLTQTDLGSRLHLDRSTLGEMLQRMLERKLISRRIHAQDKRAIQIMLTSAGRKALLQNTLQAIAAQVEFLSPLPDYLRPVFLKCMEILADTKLGNDVENAVENGERTGNGMKLTGSQ